MYTWIKHEKIEKNAVKIRRELARFVASLDVIQYLRGIYFSFVMWYYTVSFFRCWRCIDDLLHGQQIKGWAWPWSSSCGNAIRTDLTLENHFLEIDEAQGSDNRLPSYEEALCTYGFFHLYITLIVSCRSFAISELCVAKCNRPFRSQIPYLSQCFL